MRPASDLMGLPVLDLSTGKEIGKINGILVDITTRRIAAFGLNAGILRPTAFVPWSAVQNLGPDALTIPNEESLIHRKDVGADAALDDRFEGNVVFTSNGERLGVVTDYQVETETGALAGYDVRPEHASKGFLGIGRSPDMFVPISEVDTLGKESIIVPDAVKEKLHNAGHETTA